jgi:homogentisate 1,2-dioxygenase
MFLLDHLRPVIRSIDNLQVTGVSVALIIPNIAEVEMAAKNEEYREHWSREGFYGDGVNVIRPHHVPDYLSVSGPHAPHRLMIGDVSLSDRNDPAALPVPILVGRSGVQLSVSGRTQSMPFVVSNVEADEVHYIQQGEVMFSTAYGNITGGPGDFVFIPRAVPYSTTPLGGASLSVVVETPGAMRFDSAPSFLPQSTAAIIDDTGSQEGETTLLVKSFDGITRYRKPFNILAAAASERDGTIPVWKINLRNIPPNEVGHPTQFAASPNKDELLYTLSARRRRRPPIHYNADYDEVILYFSGPGAWGEVNEPGTLTWVPKGISHHGPSEDVAEGYQAWMLESRSTLRLTPAGLKVAQLMELNMYGPHPSSWNSP